MLKAIFGLAAVLALSAPAAAAQDHTPIPKQQPPANAHSGHNHSETAETPRPPVVAATFNETAGDHAIGNPRAPITMIIYASVTCPHCSQWFGTDWPIIKKNYVETGILRAVFREFPTAPQGLAFAGFMVANCVGEDKYFANIEYQMAAQKDLFEAAKNGEGEAAYLAMAQKFGIKDLPAMHKCFESKPAQLRISQTMKLAASAGIDGVPNFIVNGERFRKNGDHKTLAAHFDSLLKNAVTRLPER